MIAIATMINCFVLAWLIETQIRNRRRIRAEITAARSDIAKALAIIERFFHSDDN